MKRLPLEAGSESSAAITAADQTWTRPGVTVRLSDGRRALLRALVKECSPPPSPTVAIDRAIDLATQASQRETEDGNRGDLAIKLEDLSSLVKRGAIEQTLALAKIEVGMRSLGESLATALAEGSRERDHSRQDLPSIRSWAEQEAKRLPRPSFLAKARWQATQRIDHGHVAVDLLVERVAAADLRGPAARGAPALVRMDSLANDTPFARCDPVNSFYLMFQAANGSEAWSMSLHSLDDGGRLSPATFTSAI
ncbi:hypothetical protein [Massilia sp. TWP1-3-3]|uniref:hypothetical protein n=1 Tax=Massilia sp. TWP1-3-3 TaxID=2804573 RepID=UPI003CF668FE